ISKWENENGYPDIEYITVIAKFFGVTTDYLLGYEHNANLLKTGNGSAHRNAISCSFCGRIPEQVGTVVAGPNVYICKECVSRCLEILLGKV
ncbi:MAG: hypothetical protein FWC32_10945, partial [Firmicutes bacterium]|nr:hypothetical protein [Bacillota bacterium]